VPWDESWNHSPLDSAYSEHSGHPIEHSVPGRAFSAAAHNPPVLGWLASRPPGLTCGNTAESDVAGPGRGGGWPWYGRRAVARGQRVAGRGRLIWRAALAWLVSAGRFLGWDEFG
jgi:hypothetical protein